MSVDERLDMERQYHDQESTQARLAGRRKFACCHWCGSPDGMQGVPRETLEEMPRTDQGGEIMATWYKEYTNSEYLFHPCLSCNRDKIIPTGFVSMTTEEVLEWIDRDPMAPDYEALAAEPEPVLASLIDRESAGI